MNRLVVMGVSGSGKTVVGLALAEALALPFADGDDLHPATSLAKMTAGLPLTDEDRLPWLRAVGAWLADQQVGGVIACSALKRSYRDVVRATAPGARFVHLFADKSVLAVRIDARHESDGHFMPPGLLPSQYADLEPLGTDEDGVSIDVGAHSVADAVARATST